MDNMELAKKPVYIVGHKNPDTDSICSAIAYAYLKNKCDDTVKYIPARTGQLIRKRNMCCVLSMQNILSIFIM